MAGFWEIFEGMIHLTWRGSCQEEGILLPGGLGEYSVLREVRGFGCRRQDIQRRHRA